MLVATIYACVYVQFILYAVSASTLYKLAGAWLIVCFGVECHI